MGQDECHPTGPNCFLGKCPGRNREVARKKGATSRKKLRGNGEISCGTKGKSGQSAVSIRSIVPKYWFSNPTTEKAERALQVTRPRFIHTCCVVELMHALRIPTATSQIRSKVILSPLLPYITKAVTKFIQLPLVVI
ncbi:hypothetical protein J6590_032576 [Homalodisca vitripennis]|nr:hypothetical protein J6590_032576 [Homalodisca vitripennis]